MPNGSHTTMDDNRQRFQSEDDVASYYVEVHGINQAELHRREHASKSKGRTEDLRQATYNDKKDTRKRNWEHWSIELDDGSKLVSANTGSVFNVKLYCKVLVSRPTDAMILPRCISSIIGSICKRPI